MDLYKIQYVNMDRIRKAQKAMGRQKAVIMNDMSEQRERIGNRT